MNNKAAIEFDKLIAIIIGVMLLGILVGFLIFGLKGMLDNLGGFGSGTMDNLNETAKSANLIN